MSTTQTPVLAIASAEKFVKSAKKRFLIRMWAENSFNEKNIHILVFAVFGPSNNCACRMIGFEEFREDALFVCEAKFLFGRKLFSITNPILREIEFSDLAKILGEIPTPLLDEANAFMFSNEHGELIKREHLVTLMALALLEQKLASVALGEKGSHINYAQRLMLEMLNRTNSDAWQTILSIVG